MRDDFRTALRSLRASSSFTIPALLMLTLGVGATTAIFSVVDAVVLRGLPFDEHDRLVAVLERVPPRRGAASGEPPVVSTAAPQNYRDWTAQQHVFESMAAIASGWFTLREPGVEPESLVPQRVTSGFFDVLRVRPALGRGFTAAEEVAGRHRLVVLSDGLWRRRFGADPLILGRMIPLEDLEGGSAAADSGGYEVVGVMPPGFAYPVGATRGTDIWIPYVVPESQRIRDPSARIRYLQVIARMRPDVSLAAARAQMDQVARAIEQANPAWNKDNTIEVRPLADHVIGASVRSWMLMLLGAVGVVLLIACANIASLFLARGAALQREAGIRAALGASRWRLVRQRLAESLVLSLAGTAGAVVIAWWAVDLLRVAMPDGIPRVTTIAIDARVLAAAAALSLVTAILFGAVPALQLSAPDLAHVLKDGPRAGAGTLRRRVRHTLVVAEVALAVVLLVGAALFIGSFVSLMRVEPGFDPSNVLTAQISPRIDNVSVEPDFSPVFEDLLDRIGGSPGVVHASIVAPGIPLAGNRGTTTMAIPGQAVDPGADRGVGVRYVSRDYHRALKIPLRRGRLFDARDRKSAPGVVLINEAAARKFFPGEDPVGRVVTLRGADRAIVGVVGDVRQVSLETEALTEAYLPIVQSGVSGGVLVIRTAGNPYEVLPAVKAAVFAILPEVPLRNVGTMDELIDRRVAQRRLSMLLVGLFGLLGLALAAVGVYGVMAYLVSQRTREIGVRMALGATPSRVVRMVLFNAGVLVVSGLVIGAVASWYLSAAARAFLFRIEPTDPRAFAAAIVCLGVAALAASVIPARRAARVDPLVALRSE